MIPWHNLHLGSTVDQVSDDVVLDSAVDGQHLVLVSFSVHLDVVARHLGNQVAAVRVGELNRGVEFDLPQHGTFVSDLLGQEAGVEPVQGWDIVFLQPRGEGGETVPVGMMVCVVLYQQGGDVDLVTLEVFGQAVGVFHVAAWHSIISDDRVGQAQHLSEEKTRVQKRSRQKQLVRREEKRREEAGQERQ